MFKVGVRVGSVNLQRSHHHVRDAPLLFEESLVEGQVELLIRHRVACVCLLCCVRTLSPAINISSSGRAIDVRRNLPQKKLMKLYSRAMSRCRRSDFSRFFFRKRSHISQIKSRAEQFTC